MKTISSIQVLFLLSITLLLSMNIKLQAETKKATNNSAVSKSVPVPPKTKGSPAGSNVKGNAIVFKGN